MPGARTLSTAVAAAAAALAVLAAAGPAAAGTGATGPAGTGPRAHNPLLATTLAVEDDDDTTSADAGSPCEAYRDGQNPYAPLGADVDLIGTDTPFRPDRLCSSPQDETTVAVNPDNPRNLVAGVNDYRLFNRREGRNDSTGVAYTSFDGGRTWRHTVLPGLDLQSGSTGRLALMDAAGDPSVAFGRDGTVYYADLVFSRGEGAASGVAVNISRDGGRTWGRPHVVRLDGVDARGDAEPTRVFNDKEWIAADPASGAVYVTWTRFSYRDTDQEEFVGSPIAVAGSTDDGRHWGPMRRIGPPAGRRQGRLTAFSTGTVPVIADDGTVYVAYEASLCATDDCTGPGDHDAVVLASSGDGGRRWRVRPVAADADFPVRRATGEPTLSGELFRVNSFPSLAYDRSRDRLYLAWADDRAGRYDRTGRSVRTDGTVLWTSAVAGHRFGPLHRVGTRQDEFFPWIAADHGVMALSFYTRRYRPWNPAAGRYGRGLDYAVTGTGLPWLRATTQSSAPAVQFAGYFIGDYSAVAVGGDGVAHPVWTDFRGHPGVDSPNQDALTRSVPLG